MPKKRKPLTEEQKQRARENLAKAREAKKAMAGVQAPVAPPEPKPENLPVEEPPQPVMAPAQGVTLTQEQFQMMLDRLAARPEPQASPEAMQQAFPGGQPPSLNSQGGVVGVVERFPIDPKHYQSPVEELYDLPELRRFGLRENYVIEWNVRPVKYQTAMGTWYIEPKFELILKKKQFDEDNNELIKYDTKGNPYYPRLILGRASFFEDPPANILEAEEAGVEIDDLDKPEFQEKMRMYRYKFWLMERLSPKKPQYTTNNRREEVIGGKVYEIDEYSKPV